MSGDTEGWKLIDRGAGQFWNKSILSADTGIPFDIVHIHVEGIVDTYGMGIAGLMGCLATRPTLEECQVLAHETARLWAGEKA